MLQWFDDSSFLNMNISSSKECFGLMDILRQHLGLKEIVIIQENNQQRIIKIIVSRKST